MTSARSLSLPISSFSPLGTGSGISSSHRRWWSQVAGKGQKRQFSRGQSFAACWRGMASRMAWVVSGSGASLRHFVSASALPSFLGQTFQKAVKPAGSFAGRSGGAATGLNGVGDLGGVFSLCICIYGVTWRDTA